MKTTIYELLGMIKDNKAPKKILFNGEEWEWYKFDYVNKNSWDLFNEYVIADILNDEVEILETTITYKPDKIEKIEPFEEDVKIFRFAAKYPEVADKLMEVVHKINEIIERINKL